MPQWIEHTKAFMPVDPETVVVAELEDGYELSPLKAHEIDWHQGPDQVVRYYIID
jgi:hypothetical protein